MAGERPRGPREAATPSPENTLELRLFGINTHPGELSSAFAVNRGNELLMGLGFLGRN
jgi:hypothetical protein